MVVDVQKGLASDRVQLGAKTAGASTELVLLLDPAVRSRDVVEGVEKSLPELRDYLAREGVHFTTSVLYNNAGWKNYSAAQSPLWTFYTWANPKNQTQPVVEALVVTRQADQFNWFTQQYPKHQGIPAQEYIQALSQNYRKANRSLRVSAIAPLCESREKSGFTYDAWVKSTGGVQFTNPCKARPREWLLNWGQSVRFWAQMAAKSEIKLSHPPVLASQIEVSLGGNSLISTASSRTWRYDSSTQSVLIDWSKIDKRSLKASDWLEVKYLPRE
jgi:hypothetical protein